MIDDSTPPVSVRHDESVNVLLVDDQPGKLLSYEAILGDLGETLIKAGSAREALDCLLRHDIAVMLIDVCMPEFDGFELVSMVRQHPRFDKTAIILVSAVFTTDDDRLKGYQRGAMDFVSVPIVPEILRAKVSAFADLHRKTRQLARLNEELERRVAERTRQLEASTEHLRASEERLSLAVAAGSVATLIWDVVEDRLVGDERLAFYLDVDVAETLRGAPLPRFLAAVHEEDRARVAASISQAVERGGDCVIECRVRAADHQPRWIRLRGRVERDADGKSVRFPGALVDISEHMRLQEELREADRRKDKFLAVLSHELRNPLAAVRNAVTVLQTGSVDPPTTKWCRDLIERQVELLTRLVDDLLDVSRITEAKIKLRVESLNLTTVIKDALETALPMIKSYRHDIELKMSDREIWVDGDVVRLTQVITNLLDNAAKYQDSGGTIRVSLDVEPGAGGESSCAIIRVRDRGIGIPREMLSPVFDLFAQVESARHRAHGGLGIGLSLVKNLVELHGGSVSASSDGPGLGSEFVVRLPCRTERALPRSSEAAAPSPDRPRTPRHVLLVEDNVDAATSLSMLLKLEGFSVDVSHDGETALAQSRARSPSIVLLDIGLPGMDGHEICRRMRAAGIRAFIVAMTGFGQESDKRRTKEAGFDAHVVKPVDFSALARLIANGADSRSACAS